MPSAADEVKLVILSEAGEVLGETTEVVAEQGMVALNFPSVKPGPGFIVVKGYQKGAFQWEQRLGRFQF